ncbi:ABC transporter permease [Bradyrhizobium elkanii]|uniref:ABC transporter permease n=1 Tax=Bradyrhizobium elkanii TaxID=29448 RepID=UPI003519C8A3
MLRHVAGRLAGALPLLLGVCVFTFILVRVLPGDPAVYYATGPMASAEEIASVRKSLGLDRPIYAQLGSYLAGVATGDFGRSLTTGQPVSADLGQRLPASLELTAFAMGLALSLAVPLGVLAAITRGSWLDHSVRLLGTLGVSLPTFVTGVGLIFVFYFKLGWAPDPIDRIDPFVLRPPAVTGFLIVDTLLAGDMEAFASALGRLLLPGIAMASFVMAPIMRITRASMLSVLSSDFIRTARAGGFGWWTVYVRYGLGNALLPVLTTVGLVASYLIGANVVIEKVFAWPGVGAYALQALLAADYAAVQGYILLMALIFILINTTIDVLYAIVDPRIRAE